MLLCLLTHIQGDQSAVYVHVSHATIHGVESVLHLEV